MTVPVLARGCSCGWSSGDCTCARNRPPVVKTLSEFTDAEIAREYHQRMLNKLGDQTKGVTCVCSPEVFDNLFTVQR